VVCYSFIVRDRAARATAAEGALTKVLSLAPNHAYAQFLLGGVYIATNRAAEGIAKCELALALDRDWNIPVSLNRSAEPSDRLLVAPEIQLCRAGDSHPNVGLRIARAEAQRFKDMAFGDVLGPPGEVFGEPDYGVRGGQVSQPT